MLFVALIICCGTFKTFASEPEVILEKEPSPNVYWFTINVNIDRYLQQKIEINELPLSTAPSTMYWVQCTLMEKSGGVYAFTRSPGAVTSGSANEFTKDLFECFMYQFIKIGPFLDYMNAEEAKAIYRNFEVRDKKY